MMKVVVNGSKLIEKERGEKMRNFLVYRDFNCWKIISNQSGKIMSNQSGKIMSKNRETKNE